MNFLSANFIKLYLLLIPISSILVFPKLQGTTPGNICAFSSVFYVLYKGKSSVVTKYLDDFVVCSILFIFFASISQGILVFFDNIELSNLKLTSINDSSLLLRGSLFTQTLYLLPCLLTYLFSKYFYNNSWDKYIISSGLILAVFGFYEIIYYQLFHENGDFISNRTFGESFEMGLDFYGVSFQTWSIQGVSFLRLKSLVTEPSMYAFTLLPIWIFSIGRCKRYYSHILLLSIVLTTSATGALGFLLFYLLRKYKFFNYKDFFWLSIFILSILIAYNINDFISDLLTEGIINKLLGVNESGSDRWESIINTMNFFYEEPFLLKLFGLGFGYIRNPDFFTTLLMNSGIIGVIIFSYIFLKNASNVKPIDTNLCLLLIVVYISMLVSVSEFSYLIIWLFLGISKSIFYSKELNNQ